ncbi:protein translocase subunit SecF [Ketobacter sp.]|uniref:protein translocase subunit SecF n=1 Tax=Ketobacter sp. TaxID=2083498 RepID=UPI000F2D034B|nr:protein translocase subunit SecF [Ketobacter sp.]RLT95332.1 MAG: protein translocase subunit SecF [Ketobacter sp.]
MTKTSSYNFMAPRKFLGALSILLVIGSLVSIAINFLELGLDFTGGTQIEVEYETAAQLEPIREVLKNSAYSDASVQHFGRPEEVLVRVPPIEGEDKDKVGQQVLAQLRAQDPGVKLKRVEFVGPQVGEELRDKSGIALLIALGLMLIYVTLRFRFKFAVGAVVALFHDVIITLGFFSVSRLTFDLTALAAILAVIGYSLNDTIVVFDRVRENFRTDRGGTPVEIINNSLNQTLSRTLMTSFTTLLVLIALAFLGGELIYAFAVALIVGIVVGTYSSIYVASNLLLVQNISRDDFLEQEKVLDDMP